MDSKKKKKFRFDSVLLSDLVIGDRFHFPGTSKVVYTFERFSEKESGYIYLRNGLEKIKKKDLPVIFLRNLIKK